jgi:Ca2+-binding EF-hand superfamily protein
MTTKAVIIKTTQEEADSSIQQYNPKTSGMILYTFFKMLEKVNKDNIETERKRNLLVQ